ncbi:MAG: peptidoglycan DD-metalloendopeptidase family protein [Sulfuriferula sp.]
MKWYWVGVLLILAGCSTTQVAPVVDGTSNKTATAKRAATPAKVRDWRPAAHTVAKGETLYSIALEYGLDYRELSEWNKLTDVNLIHVGQSLRLTAPASLPPPATKEGVQVAVMQPVVVTAQPLAEAVTITSPLAVKLPYSDSAIAQLKQMDAKPAEIKPVEPKPAEIKTSEIKTAEIRPVITKPTAVSEPVKPPPSPATKESDDAMLDWMWPTQGRVIAEFSEAKSSKGVDIAGTAGQAVYAAAAGKVVYSGSGLRGYGKLVIIKHNAMYLSAYAHNQQILVKEGQAVARGQKVAEMGSTDAEQVALHFEIRQMGKPVDPLKYLPEAGK